MYQDKRIEAFNLFMRGKTLREIAKELKISRSSVERWSTADFWIHKRHKVWFERTKIIKEEVKTHFTEAPTRVMNVLRQAAKESEAYENQKELQSLLIQALVIKPARLTGNEVRFIRQFTQMTLEQFAERFDVTHPAVLKWEKSKNSITGMAWTIEKDIRLFALNALNPSKIMSWQSSTLS